MILAVYIKEGFTFQNATIFGNTLQPLSYFKITTVISILFLHTNVQMT